MGLRRFLSRRITRNQPTIALEADDVYSVLSARRRRHVLSILDENAAGVVPLRDLARKLAARETDADRAAVSSEALEAAYVSLYQSHVPVLERHGIVEWDHETGLVRRGHSVPGLVAVMHDIEGSSKSGERE